MKKNDAVAFSKRATWALKLVTACYWVSLVLMILVLIGAVTVLFLPVQTFDLANIQTNKLSIEIVSGLVLDLGNADMPANVNLRPVVMPLLGGLFIGLMCFTKLFWELTAILKEVAQRRPFTPENGKRIADMGAVLIGFSFLSPALKQLLLFRVIDIFRLNYFNANYFVDFFILITGLIVLLLAEVFKYGAFLQTEYDETL